MKANLLDRAIAAVDPVRAARRLQARARIEGLDRVNALADGNPGDGTVGGGSPLLRWWRPGVRDSAADTLRVLPSQRSQIRELVRTNPIAGGAINTNVDRVVGTGLALVAQPNRAVLGWDEAKALEWKKKTQTEFALFADSTECDYAGIQTFYEKQGLTLRSALESGDVFNVLPDGEPTPTQPYRLRIQTVEADRIGNPNNGYDTPTVAGGVRRAANGAVDAYYVYDTHPGSILVGTGGRFTGQWVTRIGSTGRRRILHHFRQLRPEQPRGVPYLAPVIDALKQLSRYTEAEIQAAVVSAFFTVIVETENGTSPAPVFGATDAQIAQDPNIALAPGAVIGLAKGEKASFADPSRPNTSFQPFVLAIIQQIGVGLGIPHELLVKQFNASYSASKAALLDAWMWFRGQRAWLARSFCQPVYETWLAEAVASGRIVAPGFFRDPLLRWAYSRADWHGDSQGSINPKDEVAAYLSAIDGRLMTRERAQWELFGTDWYDTVEPMQTEQQMLKDADLLPVPKPGAPPPAGSGQSPGDVPADPTAPTQAVLELATAVTALASREQPAPIVNVTTPPIEVNVTTPPVTVEGHEINVHLPESSIQLEAHVDAPQVHVDVDVPPAQIHVQKREGTRAVHKRDSDGFLLETTTFPLEEQS